MSENTTVAKKEITQSERFMNMVVTQFTSGVGEIALTKFQQRLAQNYFIALDGSLRVAEEKRLKKKGNNVEQLPIIWQNVNMEKLSRDVVTYARIGFDPAQKNHINMVPFKNGNTGKYDIGFVEGYRGMELKAVKYGLEVPDIIIVEVVYSTDRFKSFKKDRNNAVENYDFEIVNDFERGDIIGGFYYHHFNQTPEKNKLVVMNMKDILKRKPDKASAEFWGGEKDIWEWDDQKKKNVKNGTEMIDGWYEKMVWKTVYRAAHGDVTIDSQKIDDDYMNLKKAEMDFAEAEVREEINENANGPIIDITPDPQPDPSKNTSKPVDSPPTIVEEELDLSGLENGPDW
ncbi:recombinase RecT [Paenibacillus sp. HWE-109]|uniref:recombinase RecT n=1 Tax=Paenibacillus sp. HWE-109 TaxID=1306526 RepID=UPI001EDF337E|nr:recombinase RecT [Paenibacillus sp. HWE-109]UKS27179.1 recombinase RecT [Paenibacillus sp. HWE-109]